MSNLHPLAWIGLIYAVASFALYQLTFSNDPFGIFDPGYLLLVLLFMPIAVVVLSLYFWSRASGWRWIPAFLFVVGIGTVTFVHLFFISAMSAGV